MSNWPYVIKQISQFSAEHRLLSAGDRILIGISGGPDSVLLSHILLELAKPLEFECHLAHVNYGQRGAESDGDQNFVVRLAESKACPLSTLELNEGVQGNFQDWARQKRYQYFATLCQEYKCNKVAVAHHLSDQVETFLLRLLRGSGATGLAAMRPKSANQGLTIIRPLLCLTRGEIVELLDTEEIGYRHDRSNDNDTYQRNRLRQRILPLLASMQPSYERNLGQSLLLMQGEDQLLNELAAAQLQELRSQNGSNDSFTLAMARKGLQSLPKSLRLRVWRVAIGELTGGPQSITFHHVSKMEQLLCSGPVEATYDLPGDIRYEQGPIIVTIRKKQTKS